ncbi:hypothetical protein GS8_53 [Geobacillus stearothermophilus]|uniref:Uncharacterized protein n=1 Tax=Geobacillus stearothermophilus TaxID=1422 RepID=A0A150MIF3_GEOSE|nr:hypothetical protein GS8_53 [Geobacillus stearothermophilus]KYD24297.1 hypothetical protein B4109_2847 [Geobacillus stearothermophilus]
MGREVKNEKKRLNRKFARVLFSLAGQKMQEYERTEDHNM